VDDDSASVTQNQFYIAEAKNNGSTSTFYVDGTDKTADPSPVGTPGTVYLGSGGSGPTEPLGGDIAEVIIYNRALSNPERNAVGGYLESKYALTTAYPTPPSLGIVLENPPDNNVFSSGSGLSATCTVANGTANYTVKFYMKKLSDTSFTQVGTDQTAASPSFSQSLGSPLAAGTYKIYATVTDSTTPTPLSATSVTNTFAVDGSGLYPSLSLPVTSGNVLWLKANDGVTVDAAGVVTQWDDKSGNGKNCTQATLAKRPVRVLNVTNGYPAVWFDNDDRSFGSTYKAADGMTSALNLSAPYTVFIVFNRTVAASASRRAIQGSNNWLIGPFGGKVKHFAGGFVDNDSVSVTQNQFYIAEAKNTSSASTFYVGGVNKTSGGGNVGAPGTVSLGGSGNYPGEPLGGYVSEVVIYNTALSDADRDKVGGYLAYKYGLTTGYPAWSPPAPSGTVFLFR
jgi:hypothetical protein